MIELLKELVSINSIYPNEDKVCNFIYYLLLGLGFNVKKHYISDNRFNLLAEKGEGDFSYLLYAHTDTVPIYGEWKKDPFTLRVEGDRAIGLGSVDMKGGLVSILKAVEGFRPNNYKLKVCFGVDEENISEGAYELSKTSWLNDVKGILVPESSLPFHISEKASSHIAIGRKGRSVFTIKIHGESTHGVNTEKGISAIDEGIKLIEALKKLELTKHDKLGKTSYFVRRFESKSNSLSIPDYAEIELDFHLVPPDTSIIFKKKLNSFISNLYEKEILKKTDRDFEVILNERKTPYLEPFIVNENDYFLSIVTNSVKEVYGEYTYSYGQSVSDENIFGSLGIPTLTVGPLGDNHHSAEEWVSIESLNNLAKIYRDVLEKLDIKIT